MLALIVSMTMMPVIRAQEEEDDDNLAVEDEELDAPPQDQTRGSRMDRETIEMIMSSVSESCKQEMYSCMPNVGHGGFVHVQCWTCTHPLPAYTNRPSWEHKRAAYVPLRTHICAIRPRLFNEAPADPGVSNVLWAQTR